MIGVLELMYQNFSLDCKGLVYCRELIIIMLQ